MKKCIQIREAIIVLVCLTFVLSSCSPWRYNYPRTKVDIEQSNEAQNLKDKQTNDVSTTCTESASNEYIKSAAGEPEELSVGTSEETTVELTPARTASSSVDHSANTQENGTIVGWLTEKLGKEPQKLLKAQEVEKTALSGWVRIMIILFVVGFILLVVGILLSVLLHPGFWWLFYMFGVLCILAGFIVLILGLVGVMA